MEGVITATGDVVSIVGKVFEVMTANPVTLFFLAASLLGVGIGVFQSIKNAAR